MRTPDWRDVLRRELNLPAMAGHRDEHMIDELADHLEEVYREALGRGVPPEEARTLALEALGDVGAAARDLGRHEPARLRGAARRWTERREHGLRQRGGAWTVLADAIRDLRVAMRGLRRRPVFAAIVVGVLGLGMGGTVAIFTLVDSILLSPLPFHEQDKLVSISHTAPTRGIMDAGQTAAWHFTYEDGNTVFDDIGMWDGGTAIVTGAGDPETVSAMSATSGVFRTLGIGAAIGRLFTPADEELDAARIALLGYAYWQTRFGGDPAVLGQTVRVNGLPAEVVGVAPPTLASLGSDPAVIVPLRYDKSALFVGNIGMAGIARLRQDVSIERATVDLSRLLPTAWDRFPGGSMANPDQVQDFAVELRPLKAEIVGLAAPLLWTLLGSVAVVLLIACANVANLFLVRSEALETDMAVRTALGAGRRRIAWEHMKESLLLGIAGGVVGIGLSVWGVDALLRFGPGELPRVDEISLGPTVLLLALALSLGVGVAFGLLPRLRSRGGSLISTLRLGGGGAIGGKQRRRAQGALVVGQMALTLVLLVGSGLLFRSYLALRSVDPGFKASDDVLAFRVFIPEGEVGDPEDAAATHEQVARRLTDMPGVESVGLASAVPMDGSSNFNALYAEGITRVDEPAPMRRHKWVGEGYFETMGIPLLAGRAFTWSDVHVRAPGAIVSESLAREFWGSPATALGQRLSARPEPVRWHQVVGVVPDVRDDGMDQDPVALVYWPQVTLGFWQGTTEAQAQTWRTMAYAVASERIHASGFVRAVHDAVWDVNPNLALQNVSTVSGLMAASMARRSFTAMLIGLAAVLALILGAVGVYGVISYAVSQRSRELGMRIALGAGAGALKRMVVRQGLTLALVGVSIGIAGVLALAPALNQLLYGVDPRDPLTLGAVALGLLLIAGLASYVPARRAARVDPMIALREE